MTEQTTELLRGRELVERVREKAHADHLSIDVAAKQLGISPAQYYAAQKKHGMISPAKSRARRKRLMAGRGAKRKPAVSRRRRGTETDGSPRGVNARDLRSQIGALTLENGQLREELLEVLLENRQFRKEQE
jgi:hypothetical protein